MTDSKNIARILRVNHAGECGAIRIYQAQLLVARLFHPSLVGFFQNTLSHEKLHRRDFRQSMRSRKTYPCAALPFWGIGGFALGIITALMGKTAMMVCTKAVEGAVHQHLEEQVIYLEGRDDELRSLVLDIKVEEVEHLNYAINNIKNPKNFFWRLLDWSITLSTEIVMWLSTYGAITRMVNEIRRSINARPAV